jgi:two-component system sensor histidine kinase HydH
MAQCLLNLLINAIDAMDGGGRLAIRCEAVDGREVRVSVSDTGRGMAPEEITQIFDPYYTTKSKGTGLGLAIVHKIVEAHGARLNVESAPGRGTTFMLHIACVDGETQDEGEDDGEGEPIADRR